MQAVVDGMMTNYAKQGSGKKVIVMLHGWGDQASTFQQLAKALDQEYLIFAPDLPGFGGTQKPGRPWGVDEYAKFVADWLNKIGHKNVYGVIGHSNGGAIAISMLSRGDIKSKKLVLLASSGIRDADKLRKMLLGGGAKLVKMPLKLLPKTAQSKIKRRAYEAFGSDYGLMPEMDASYRKIVSQDMQAAATKLKQPTLLIYGHHDKTTPVKYGQLFNEAIPNSQLQIIEEAGHMLHHHQPAQVAKLVGDFLDA